MPEFKWLAAQAIHEFAEKRRKQHRQDYLDQIAENIHLGKGKFYATDQEAWSVGGWHDSSSSYTPKHWINNKTASHSVIRHESHIQVQSIQIDHDRNIRWIGFKTYGLRNLNENSLRPKTQFGDGTYWRFLEWD
jgi:hypothetical protein